jgi:CBS domain-containing protein
VIALLDELKSHPPFTLLDEKAFHYLQTHTQIAYYPNQTTLIEQGTIPTTLYIIIKGVVETLNEHGEHHDLYHSHDLFGAIEHLKQQPSSYHYTVTEELICFEIEQTVFEKLCSEYKAFKNYFFSSMAERVELLKEKQAYASMSDMMVARVDETLLHEACVVPSNTPIVEALTKMENVGATSLLVENDEGYGIVTDADFRYYILHKEEKKLEEVSQIQTYPIYTITHGELLFNMLLLMTEHNFKHLPVLNEQGEVLGMAELVDVVSSFSNQSHLITVQMERAKTIEAVVSAAKRLEVMIGALHAKGVKSRYIAKLVSEINKKMYSKLFEFIMPASWHQKCSLILLGSEGRAAQTLRTDQDNALIFEEGFMPENVEEVTTQFIETLDEIGFPRCKGNVMLINPKWCKEIQNYRTQIREWVDQPSSENFMDMAIFFDSTAVAGNKKLHHTLIKQVISEVKENQSYLMHFARAIENFDSPLGLFSRFITEDAEHKGKIDIKKGALFAFVHGVRTLALEFGIRVTNTSERLKALHKQGFFSREDTEEYMEALEVLHTLRLHAQLEKLSREEKIDNYITLSELGKLERDLLKEALKSVSKFKKVVSYHYHLGMV